VSWTRRDALEGIYACSRGDEAKERKYQYKVVRYVAEEGKK
jgi:hypothetical protein